jgi:hypothetical protein
VIVEVDVAVHPIAHRQVEGLDDPGRGHVFDDAPLASRGGAPPGPSASGPRRRCRLQDSSRRHG